MNGSKGDELKARARSEGGLLVVLCGLPASGKSFVASTIGPLLDAEWVSTDRTREQMFPLADVGKSVKYSKDASARTYAEVERRAAEALEAGRSVLIDGTYLEPTHRARPIELAHQRDRPVLLIKVFAPDPLVRQRLAVRKPGEEAKSEADLAVYEMMKERLEGKKEGYLDLEEDEPKDPDGRLVPTAVIDTSSGKLTSTNVASGSLVEALLVELEAGLLAQRGSDFADG